MIHRQAASVLLQLAKGYPILAITGPRQAGKTTLAQATFPDKPYVSLVILCFLSVAVLGCVTTRP